MCYYEHEKAKPKEGCVKVHGLKFAQVIILMIRIPHVFVPNLKYINRKVARLIIVHPRSVQYIQHDPDHAQLSIKYTSGEEVNISDSANPAYVKKMFDDLVYHIKDCSMD